VSGQLFAPSDGNEVSRYEPPAAKKPTGPDEWQQAVDFWGEMKWGPVDSRPDNLKKRKLRITRKGLVGQALSARLGEVGLNEVLKVTRWGFRSNHDRAKRVLREGGHLSPKTLFRVSNFPEYLGFADEEEDGFHHHTGRGGDSPPPPPMPPRKPKLPPELADELRAINKRYRDEDVGDFGEFMVIKARKEELEAQGRL